MRRSNRRVLKASSINLSRYEYAYEKTIVLPLMDRTAFRIQIGGGGGGGVKHFTSK